ncbi:MAG: hypothetical protein R2861_15170 [Desulfobacterales bacterium]
MAWYRDADGDGYGDPSATLAQQSQPDEFMSRRQVIARTMMRKCIPVP